MEFNPSNIIIQRCIRGMDMEEKGDHEGAAKLFLEAFNDATNDFEKYIAAFYVARHQKNAAGKLRWLQTALDLALKVDNHSVKGALSSLYSGIAQCYEDLGDAGNAEKNNRLAISAKAQPDDKGPFYHGTRAHLQIGDMLTPGGTSNYKNELVMNHIYFTALVNGAGLAAALAKGSGHERVYIIEPTGSFENDPNVTDKKFPGNPSRSYRSDAPLKIIGEVTDWVKITPQELQQWRDKLAASKGEIIN